MARLLMAHKADPSAKDSEGKTPLFRARETDLTDMIKLQEAAAKE